MPINDAHCHFFSRGFFESLAREKDPAAGDGAIDALLGQLGWEPPGPPETLADRWVAELDRHQIRRAALIASVPGDEESVATAVARHPSRLVGFFMVNPKREGAETATARGLDRGLRTVCLFPAMHRYALDDPAVRRIVDRVAQKSGAALFIHCGVLSVGVRKRLALPSRFDIRLGHPLAVQGLAATYPHVPIIIPHFGAGYFREALMAADMAGNIHFDTSSSNGWIRYHQALTLTEVFARALDVAGPDRILFGTDSSFFPRGWQVAVWEAQKRVVQDLALDAPTAQKIFSGNFDRLFPLEQ